MQSRIAKNDFLYHFWKWAFCAKPPRCMRLWLPLSTANINRWYTFSGRGTEKIFEFLPICRRVSSSVVSEMDDTQSTTFESRHWSNMIPLTLSNAIFPLVVAARSIRSGLQPLWFRRQVPVDKILKRFIKSTASSGHCWYRLSINMHL
jgi:hypothetical protein